VLTDRGLALSIVRRTCRCLYKEDKEEGGGLWQCKELMMKELYADLTIRFISRLCRKQINSTIDLELLGNNKFIENLVVIARKVASDDSIRSLLKHEMPYNDLEKDKIEIASETHNEMKGKDGKLGNENFSRSTYPTLIHCNTFQQKHRKVRDAITFFVGRTKIRSVEYPQ